MAGVDLSKDEQRTTYGGLILFFPSCGLRQPRCSARRRIYRHASAPFSHQRP